MDNIRKYITVLVIACMVILVCDGIEKILFLNKTSFENHVENISNNYSKEISDKLIRFHVIANSDLDNDQRVKLEIRDAILNNIGSELSRYKTKDESLIFLKSNLNRIESIADGILKKESQNYRAKAMLGEFNFPIKQYGDITLPEGKYTALRVVLGDGGGKNWWCVMFPPLCFIDITHGLTTDETNKSLEKILTKGEVKSITSSKQNKENKNSKTKIELRFKSIEIVKKLIAKIK